MCFLVLYVVILLGLGWGGGFGDLGILGAWGCDILVESRYVKVFVI